jgi:hypothetical protein
MLDFLRNRGRSERELRQEVLSAYLDGELTPAERDRFEQQLAQNSDLRAELADLQFWQQQMRDLPARRVPRNFTLDPALYGPPQRQFWGSAYPAFRAATALTAFLLVIVLAANVYMSSFSTEAVSQTAMAPALESAPMIAAEVEEAAPQEIVPEDGGAVSEEEAPLETDMAADEELLPQMSAAPLATPFALETSIDKESEAAEAPIEIAGAEETMPSESAAEESVEEPKFSKQEEPLDESLREELAQSLDILEETAEPPLAGAREAVPTEIAEIITSEDLEIEEVPPAANFPAQDEEMAAPMSDTSSAVYIPLSLGLEELSIGLGLLLISLAILTLIAYRRR